MDQSEATPNNRTQFLRAVALIAAFSLAGVSGLVAQQIYPTPTQGAVFTSPVQGERPVGPMGPNVPQNQTPVEQDMIAVVDALPATAPAVPKKPRRIFVFARAKGFVHSNIPLAAYTMKALGDKTGAWKTTISYSLADFTAANLAKYDAIMLDNTTGAFLDDSNAAATAARHQLLLNFVRSGKGLIMVHAAADSYHDNGKGAPNMAGLRGRRGGARAGRPTRAQMAAMMRAYENRPKRPYADAPVSTWPAFSAMVGGWFKWHWPYPQLIYVHLDDPSNPILAGYHGRDFTIHDETYTFAGFNPANVHVLTSVDYAKMSPADKAKEDMVNPDHFYPLSWIHRVGKGRVFYQAHGHDEHVYANRAYLEELLAGTQYALGDLKVNDAPGNVKLK